MEGSMKKVFIINPKTNWKKQYEWMESLKKANFKDQIIIEKTQGEGYAQNIAQKYALEAKKEPIHLFACGGDGTLHEVVNGIAESENIYLSVCPMGTGNDFVKSFPQYTKSDFLNMENYQEPIEEVIDCLKVNGEYVINTVSFGFDVKVAEYANQIKKVLPLKGILPYYTGMLGTLLESPKVKIAMQIDEERIPFDSYMFVVFCNGKYYGGGYKPCPEAKLDNGFMDSCLIPSVSRRQILKLAKLYQKGEHVQFDDLVSLNRAKVVHIDTNNQNIFGNLDGEVRALKNPTIEVLEKQIHLLLPNVGEDS